MEFNTNKIFERRDYLQEIINQKEKSIQYAPKGSLRSHKRNNSFQYYHRVDSANPSGRYIRAGEASLARKLAQKSYDKAILKKAKNEFAAVDMLCGQYENGAIEEEAEKLPEFRKPLISPIKISDEDFVREWVEKTYEPKQFFEGSPEYYTDRQERVRSKSEIIIANMLDRLGVPYKYEKPLRLRGYGTVHPDFTLLNVPKRKEIVWEHFGMMDDCSYCEKALLKMDSYQKSGYFHGDNLIITFESSVNPINTKQIEGFIRHYLIELD